MVGLRARDVASLQLRGQPVPLEPLSAHFEEEHLLDAPDIQRQPPELNSRSYSKGSTVVTDWHSDDEAKKLGKVPLLPHQDIIIDDDGATLVLVFPRQRTGYHGTVHENEYVHDPKKEWEKVFGSHKHAQKHYSTPLQWRKNHSIRVGEYQSYVREQLLRVFKESGIVAHSVESVDGDEVFLKLSLDPEKGMIRRLATAYRYLMPLKEEEYKEAEGIGAYTGGRPLRNALGMKVPLYTEYDRDVPEVFQDFRHVDEVRLIMKHLSSCVNFSEMLRQNIVSRYFPGAKYTDIKTLNHEWAGLRNLGSLPSQKNEEQVRAYFGEEVAFFFQWFSEYLRFLRVLGGISVILLFRKIRGFNQTQQDMVQCLFGLAIVIGESLFHKRTSSKAARTVQAWGMKSYDVMEDELPTYQGGLDNTSEVLFRRAVTDLALVAYLIFFGWAALQVSQQMAENFKEDPSRSIRWGAMKLAVMIKFLNFVWRKIAFWLVVRQNHRTQTRFNNQLLRNVAIVKLFSWLFNLAHAAFWKPMMNVTCKADLSSAAHDLYGKVGWPENVNIDIAANESETHIPQAMLGFLSGSMRMSGNLTCISACYPVACDEHEPGVPQRCATSCMRFMEGSLQTLYVVHIFSTTLNLAIPVILTRAVVCLELLKASRQKRHEEEEDVQYSLLQLQAKCYTTAKYDIGSWGGSYVEDFLELSMSYAMLAFFGLCNPITCAIGFVVLSVEYRLLAFRMINVTCRPMPRGAHNIGDVRGLLDAINSWAPSCNVAIMITQMQPYRSFSLLARAVLFVLLDKGVTALRFAIDFMVPSEPDDVKVIRDYNSSLKRHWVREIECEQQEKKDYDVIDIGLKHPVGGRGYTTGESANEDDSDDAFC